MTMSAPRERPVVYRCEGELIVGIVHEADGTTGVLMVVGGPQVRFGSHRLYVQQARRMAAFGVAVFRFDCRGMGDSSGRFPGFEHLASDIREALAAFREACPALRRIVLWGLCDGASAVLLYLHEHQDAGIVGLCLLNPWVRTPAIKARTQVRHYYVDRLRQAEFWKKLLRGEIGRGAFAEGWGALHAARAKSPYPTGASAFPTRMAEAWSCFDGPVLLVLSELDYTAREFIESTRSDPAWRAAVDQPRVTRLDIAGADHTFSTAEAATALLEGTTRWLAHEVLQAVDDDQART